MSYIFDSHAHYDDRAFDADRHELLASLLEKGVDKVMNVSASLEGLKPMLELVHQYDFMWASTGVHPSDTYELSRSDIKEFEAAIKDPKVKAVGEIGLDYHFEDTNKPCQVDWFVDQIEMAKKHNLPIIVHSRDAAADTLDIIKQTHADNVGGVIHCFSYAVDMAKIYMDLGFHIGVGGVLTFKNAKKLKEIVEYMPMDLLLLETDCPYMAPTPFRGERNDSSFLSYVVDAVCSLKNMDADDVRRITNENACRLYRI